MSLCLGHRSNIRMAELNMDLQLAASVGFFLLSVLPAAESSRGVFLGCLSTGKWKLLSLALLRPCLHTARQEWWCPSPALVWAWPCVARNFLLVALAVQADSSSLAAQQLLSNFLAVSHRNLLTKEIMWQGTLQAGCSYPCGSCFTNPTSNRNTWSPKQQGRRQKLPGEAGRSSSLFLLQVLSCWQWSSWGAANPTASLWSMGGHFSPWEQEGKAPLYNSVFFLCLPTPAPFPLLFCSPTLQEDALGVGFDVAANTLRRCVNDDWQLLKALFQHLAVTTPHTSAA